MPGPLATNRLRKSAYMGNTPKRRKALRRHAERMALRLAGYERVSRDRGYRKPGSENPRKRG